MKALTMKNALKSIATAIAIYTVAATVASADAYAKDRQILRDSAAQSQLINDPTPVAHQDRTQGERQTLSTRNADAPLAHESLKAYGGR